VLLFCLVYPSAFPFEGVKVEATGKKIEYLMVSFFAFPHHQEQGLWHLKSIRNGSRVGLHHVYDLRTNILFFL
jgi:hypothetical protein